MQDVVKTQLTPVIQIFPLFREIDYSADSKQGTGLRRGESWIENLITLAENPPISNGRDSHPLLIYPHL